MDIDKLKAIDELYEMQKESLRFYAKLRHYKIRPEAYSKYDVYVFRSSIKQIATKRKILMEKHRIRWDEVKKTNGYRHVMETTKPTTIEHYYARAVKLVIEMPKGKAEKLLDRSLQIYQDGNSCYHMEFIERWISLNLKIPNGHILWGHKEPMMCKLKRVISGKIL